ncbi:taste receptor type 2 member 4-like [Mantella aurantiaca]
MNPEGHVQNQLSFMIILFLELSTGMFMYLFVTCVLYCDFIKTKTLSSSYKIVLCLSVSNLCYGVVLLVVLLDFVYSLGISSMYTAYIYVYMLLLTISSCAWLSASLGLFYFVKISSFESGCFSWMKRNIGSIVPWMLLGNLPVSLINSALSSLFFVFSPKLSHNTTDGAMSLISTFSQSSTAFIHSAIANSIGPFSVLFFTTLYSAVFLKKHSQRMKKSVQMPNSEQLRSYDKVVWRMTQSLLFYGIYYIVMVTVYFVIITQLEFGFWLSFLILALFPVVQSVLLVIANPKLKAAWNDLFTRVHV